MRKQRGSANATLVAVDKHFGQFIGEGGPHWGSISPIRPAVGNGCYLRGTAAESQREPDDASPFVINPAQPGQSYTSVCSANSELSSTSMRR